MITLKKMPAFLGLVLSVAIFLTVAISIGYCPLASAENSATTPSGQDFRPPQDIKAAPALWQKLAGTWEGADYDSIMRIFLTVNADTKTVYGSHKAISKDGKRVDMVGEDTLSINGNIIGENLAEVSWVSGYNPDDRATGTAKITIVDDNTIKWEISSRDGTSYLPYEIEFKKISPTAVEAKHILFKNAWSVFDLKTKKQFALKSSINYAFTILGQPQAQSLFLSTGLDSGNIYKYGDFEILADNNGIITYIYLTSASFITPGNLKVGDSIEKMTDLYGPIDKAKKTKDDGLEWYTYILDSKNGFKSSFAIEGETIKAIRFSMLKSGAR